MQRLIESIANGIGNTIAFAAETGVLFVLFVLLWAAFGAALIWSQGSLDATWSWVRSLHFVAQAVLWLLFLPVMAGLWIWEMSWPALVRLLLVGGLAGWNLLVLLPRALTARP